MHAEHAELISELRAEIEHLNREHERLERLTATGALLIIVEQMEMIRILQEQIKQDASCP